MDQEAKKKLAIEAESQRLHAQMDALEKERRKFRRGVGCIVGVVVSLGLLGYFLYKIIMP
ncbi:MAG TPA: hypothetical protein VMO47_13545 [Rhodothermales bacterium]|nr:hypothetical protein [Rhodothermales bacterium]